MTVTIEEAKERMEELARLAIGGVRDSDYAGGVAGSELKPVEMAVALGSRVPGRWKGKITLVHAQRAGSLRQFKNYCDPFDRM